MRVRVSIKKKNAMSIPNVILRSENVLATYVKISNGPGYNTASPEGLVPKGRVAEQVSANAERKFSGAAFAAKVHKNIDRSIEQLNISAHDNQKLLHPNDKIGVNINLWV